MLLQPDTLLDQDSTYKEMGLDLLVLYINQRDLIGKAEKNLEQVQPALHHPPQYNLLLDQRL